MKPTQLQKTTTDISSISSVEVISHPIVKNLFQRTNQMQSYEEEKTYLAKLFMENDKLKDCTPMSLYWCINQTIKHGLSFSPTHNLATIVPYFDKNIQQYKATLTLSYQGLMAIMFQTGMLKEFPIIRLVYSNEYISEENGIITHKVKFTDKGNLIGGVCLANNTNSGRIHFFMSIEEFNKRKSLSKTQSFWVNHLEQMCKKTLVRELYKQLPKLNINKEFRAEFESYDDANVVEYNENDIIVDVENDLQTNNNENILDDLRQQLVDYTETYPQLFKPNQIETINSKIMDFTESELTEYNSILGKKVSEYLESLSNNSNNEDKPF